MMWGVRKYRNRIVRCGDEVFDSKKEMLRWQELTLLEKGKAISNLRRQVPFVLAEGFRWRGKCYRAVTYVADFVYEEGGRTVVEDVKSDITRQDKVYRIKMKLFIKKYCLDGGYEFREVL